MDIGKCFSHAWGLFRLDWGPLAVTALVAAVIVGVARAIVSLALGGLEGLSTLSLSVPGAGAGAAMAFTLIVGVVAVLTYAWMYAVTFHMILRRVREGRPAEYADMQSFDQIGAFTVAAVVLGVIIGIGFLLLVVPGLIFVTLWVFALPLIGDRRVGVAEAMSESRDIARRLGYMTTFVTWLVGAIVVGVIVGLLGVIPVVGVVIGLVAVPFVVAYVLSMYFQAQGQGAVVDEAIARAAHR
jgi:uncharacterized membrane protein